MQTTIKQIGPVEYELDITATAEDLAPEFKKALREQRARIHLKGFRPGKVPLSLVKKMYGKDLAHGVVDKSVQETYEDLVLNSDEHDVLGQPKITDLEYEMDGDLHAVIHFGVRPEIALQDLSGETVDTLIHAVTDDEVEEEIERLLEDKADFAPVEDEPIAEADLVVYDLQEVDQATRMPLLGKRDEDQTIYLDDPSVDESLLMSALREVLLGAKAGKVVHFHFEHDKAHDGLIESLEHAHFFEATIKEVERRDILELDEEFVKDITNERLDDVAAFREEVRKQLENSWQKRAREFLEGNITERMLELHPMPVPESVIELYLDSYIEDIKRRNRDQLPDNFPLEAFKEANREEVEKRARWMLIHDALVDAEELDVTNEDLEQFFEQEAEKDENFTAVKLRQYYESRRLIDSLEQRLLNQKVFDLLAGRMEVVEKDIETVEREQEQREAEARAKAEAEARAEEEAEARAEEEAKARAREEAEATAVEAAALMEDEDEALPEAEVTAQAEEAVEEPVAEKPSKGGIFRFLKRKKK